MQPLKNDALILEKKTKETGIDLEQYKTDLVADSIIELIETPFTIFIHIIIWPLLISVFTILFAIWFVWPLSWMGAILWILTGLVVGPFTGFAIALYVIGKGLSETSKNLYESVLDTIKVIAEDLKNKHVDSEKQNLPTFNEWLQIIRLVIVIPTVRQIVRTKLWPVGDPIANILVLNLTRSESKGLANLKKGNIENNEYLSSEKYSQMLIEKSEQLRKNLDNIHKLSFNLTLIPLRYSMLFGIGLNLLILLIIWYFFLL